MAAAGAAGAGRVAAVKIVSMHTNRRRTASVLYTLLPAAPYPVDAAHMDVSCEGESCCSVALVSLCARRALTDAVGRLLLGLVERGPLGLRSRRRGGGTCGRF